MKVDHIHHARTMGSILDHQERMDYLDTIPEKHRNLVLNLMPIFLSVTIANINTTASRKEALDKIPTELRFAHDSSTVKSFVKARVIHLFNDPQLKYAKRF